MTDPDPANPSLSTDAASVYEQLFVPALFGQWAAIVAEEATLQPGDRVLDLACGTGVLARAAADSVSPGGSVVGLDPAEGMLAVAGRNGSGIEWRQGLAESLPFEDASFDAVVCQFGLMFFQDPRRVLQEARRVLRPDGRAVFAVWASLDNTPGYAAFVALLERLFGASVAAVLRSPFAMGDRDRLGPLFEDAGFPAPRVSTRVGVAKFPGLETWIRADAKGWLELDDEQCRLLLGAAREELSGFVTAEGVVEFEIRAHLASTASGQ